MAGCLSCREKITLAMWCGCIRHTYHLGVALREVFDSDGQEREGIEFRLADAALRFLEDRAAVPAGNSARAEVRK